MTTLNYPTHDRSHADRVAYLGDTAVPESTIREHGSTPITLFRQLEECNSTWYMEQPRVVSTTDHIRPPLEDARPSCGRRSRM